MNNDESSTINQEPLPTSPGGPPAAVPSQPSERIAGSSSIAAIRKDRRQPPHPRQPSQLQWNKSQLCCVVSKGSPLGRKLRCPYQKKLGKAQLSPPLEGEGLGGEGPLLGEGGDGVDRKPQLDRKPRVDRKPRFGPDTPFRRGRAESLPLRQSDPSVPHSGPRVPKNPPHLPAANR